MKISFQPEFEPPYNEHLYHSITEACSDIYRNKRLCFYRNVIYKLLQLSIQLIVIK